MRMVDVPPETRTVRLLNTNQEPCPYGILLGHNSFKISTHFIPVYDLFNDAVSKSESWSSFTHEHYVALLLNIMWAYSWALRGPAPEHRVGILLNITWSCSWILSGHTPEHYEGLLLNIMWAYSRTLWVLCGIISEHLSTCCLHLQGISRAHEYPSKFIKRLFCS
jgi:hypothetical protein